ncbi:signal peptidase I [Streptomyces sp. GC420]|uniref:signal peptidase I n=1 Tax=Streptomyces sp. GC420 TaxID=2697568 RepID=UPI00141524A0|nr:signal peptidase I [Streptomyces sp. GC420]NBM15184.1 signal peptidase I [Streptomyces sp. GC420]
MSGTVRRTSDDHGSRLGNVLSGIAVAVGCVLFLGGFAWGAMLYLPYTVPTDSMSPTVPAGDRVLAERIDGSEVRRGDVVVFEEKIWGNVPMVKRVVGVGGDTVACCDAEDRLTVNGEPVEEPYLRGEKASYTDFSTEVAKDKLFLLGDERRTSVDSRSHLQDAGQGTVPLSAVRARVEGIAWPAGHWGILERPAGFAELPGGISVQGPLKLIVWSVVAGAALILGGAAYGPVAKLAGRRRGKDRSVAVA